MILKEKFKQWLDTNPRLEIREAQLEVIADDYAIDFAEWLASDDATYLVNDLIIIGEINCNPTPKELLEIFKNK